ncbi:hypothetical protein ACQY74_000571 (plasmid) [Rhizobium leguminosarum bv. trifolii]|jgi:hypothetical protein
MFKRIDQLQAELPPPKAADLNAAAARQEPAAHPVSSLRGAATWQTRPR